MKGLKQILGLLMLLLISVTMFGQSTVFKKLENQDSLTLTEGQKDSAIFYTKYDLDKDGVMEVYQLPYRVLESAVNLFRTEFGNISGEDSVAILKGLELHKDSTVIKNDLITNGKVSHWFGQTNDLLNSKYMITSDDNGTARVLLGGESRQNEAGARFQYDALHNANTPTNMGFGTLLDFRTTYNAVNELTGAYERYDSVPANNNLFRFTHGSGVKNGQTSHFAWKFLDIHRDSTNFYVDKSFNIYQNDFYGSTSNLNHDAVANKVFSVSADYITHTVTTINEAGLTVSILTTAEFNTLKAELGGSVPIGFQFMLDSNSDGVGDVLLLNNGFEFVKIETPVYTGGVVSPN